MIIYGQAKKVLAKYAGTAGKCADDETLQLFVKMVLQYLLLHGTYGNERMFSFQAERGVLTLPRELEVPLKIKFNGAVGSVWNRWFEYHSGNILDTDCLKSDSIIEDPNLYPTVYDMPQCGAYPAVMATCTEAADSYVVVKGTDPTGREIFTSQDGETKPGVRLSLCKGVLKSSPILFGRITEISKPITKGYVNLIAVDETHCGRKFLADYDPFETSPGYRRVRCVIPNCPAVSNVTVLGRIRLKDQYIDSDTLPFDNLLLIQSAGQTVNSMYNTDVATGLQMDQYVKGLIETEGNYKKVNNGQPIELFRPLSGGSIKNAGRSLRQRSRRY